MKKSFFFSLALCSSLFAELEETNLIQKKFNYENRTSAYKDFNIPKVAEIKDISKKKYENIELKKNNNLEAKIKANEINSYINSSAFNEKLEAQKRYILDDEKLGYKDELKKQHIEKSKYSTPTILNPTEKVYIAISSSMPIELIRNYIKQTSNIRNEVTFILKGTIPNKNQKYGHTKIKPTLDYIRNILANDGNQLEANIFIDPKSFHKYNIERVPAFVYVKDIMQDNTEYFKVYGAIHTKLSMKKILEKKYFKNLEKLSNKL